MRTSRSSFGCALLHEVLDHHVTKALQQRLAHHCLLKKSSERFVFPGPQPLSIERSDLTRLKTRPYVMCEKTDGHRAAMMFDVVEIEGKQLKMCVVFNRSGRVWVCPIQRVPSALWQGTVFDGEIVKHKGDSLPCFLVFDALRVSGMWLEQVKFSERLNMARLALESYRYTTEYDPLQLRVKVMIQQEDFSAAEGILSAKTLEYNTDGLLLTPDVPGFVIGRAKNGMFKLKPPGTHTVDFMLEAGGGLSVYKPDEDRQVIVAHVDAVPTLLHPGAIVECRYAGQGDTWTVVLVRDDKRQSNDFLTFTKTMVNQEENLSVQDVICSLPNM